MKRWREIPPEMRAIVRDLIDSFVRVHEEVEKRQNSPWPLHEAWVAVKNELFPSVLLCAHCPPARPASCIGQYHGEKSPTPSCDNCCGHSQEDGACLPLTEKEKAR